jgi:hypothetical protein
LESLVNWIKQIIQPLRSKRRQDRIGRATAIAAHHLRRRWVEVLESRRYLTGVTYGGLTFNATDSGAAQEVTDLQSLFTTGHTTGGAYSVSYTGTIADSGSTSINGTFTVAVNAGAFTVSATNLSVSLNNLISVSNGTASFALTTSSLSGSISNFTLANGGSNFTLNSMSVNWATTSNSFALDAAGSVTVETGQSMDGNFAFSDSGSDVHVGVTNASLVLGNGQLSVSGMSGSLDWSSGGFVGTGTASTSFTSDNASFSGNLGFTVNTLSSSDDTNLQITGTAVHVTVDGLQFTSDVSFEDVGSGSNISGSAVAASLSNVSLAFGDGTNNYITLTSPTSGPGSTSSALFESGSFIGVIGANVTINAPGNVSASGLMVLEINSGSSAQTLPDPTSTDSTPPDLTLPAGPMVDVLGQNINLHISSSQQISGNFEFDYDNSDPAGSKTITVTASDVAGTFGAASLANASGTLTIADSGITGTITGDAAFSGSSASTSGQFTATITGGSVQLSGTGVTITVDGENFTGSFAVDAEPTYTSFTMTNASLSFGGGVVSVTGLTGNFEANNTGNYSGSVSGTLSASSGSAAISGSVAVEFGSSNAMTLSGTSDTITVGDQTVSGNFTLTDNSGDVNISASGVSTNLGGGLVQVTNGSLNASITDNTFSGNVSGSVVAGTASAVQFSGPISVDIEQDSISASSAAGADTLTVAGQSFTAGFAFSEDDAGDLDLALDDINMSLGNGALAVTNAAGTLVVSSDGVSGSVSAGLSSNIANFSGNLGLTFGSGTVVITASNVNLTVGDNTLTGSMTVTQNGSVLDLADDSLAASLGGGLVTISPPAAGSNVPASTLEISNDQITGSFSGQVAAGSGETGASFSGLVSVTVEPGSITATGTGDTLTVGGSNITADFNFHESSGNLELSVSNVNFALGSLLSVDNASGDLTVTSSGVTGDASGTITKGIGNLSGDLAVSFAPGSIEISGTNDSLSYADQSLSGSFVFTQNSTGLHLSSSNMTASLGGGLVKVTNGSATLAVSSAGVISGSFTGTVSGGTALASSGTGFAGTVSVAVGNGVITASGTSDTLTVAGQSFSASFSFYENAAGLELQVSGLNFALGSVLSVSGAGGILTVNSSGVTGSTAGTVTSALSGFSGTLGVTFGGGNVTVSGTNDSLTIAGQRINGNFVFTSEAGGNLNLSISSLNVSLGGGLVTLSGATANLNVSSAGAISGNFNGTLAAGTASSVTFGGNVGVAVGGGNITFTGTGDTLSVAGQTLSGNFGFAEDSNAHSLDLTMSNASLSLGSALSVTNGAGTVNITSSGITGNITGTINNSIAGLTANSFGVTFAPGVLEIVATGAALTVGGQSISGNFDFLNQGTAIQLTGTNLGASLGGGLVTVSNGSGTLSVSNTGTVSGNFTGVVAAGSSETGAGFSGLVSVNVQPGSITASGVGDVLTVGGYQLSTNFNFSDTAGSLTVGVSDLNFSLGSALSITNATGSLLVTNSGVTGTAAGTVSSSFSNISITGSLGVGFANGTVSISGTNDQLVAGNESISGNFIFVKDSNGIELTSSNFAASLGNGLVDVTNGSGDLTVNGSSIAGSFAGNIVAGTVGGGASFSGPIQVSVGGGTIAASTPVGSVDTITIAGQSVSAGLVFSDSSAGLSLALSDMDISLGGGAVSLSNGSGQLSVTSAGVSGSAAGTLASSFSGFAFSGNLAATFAPGSLALTGTNDILTAGDQSISGNFNFASSTSNGNQSVTLSATNFGAVLGGGLVNITNGGGTLSISGGNLTGSFGGTLAAGTTSAGLAGNVTVSVLPGSVTALGTNDTLTVGGNAISAGFYFHEDSSGLELTLSNVNLSMGGGAIAVTNAGGTVLVSHAGVTGSIFGGLSANVPNVTFNSTNFSVTFGAGSYAIGGTGVNLTAYGQQIGGNFVFTQSGNSVALAVANLSLSLGGIVNVTGGTGSFTLTSGTTGGMSGSATGNVAIAGSSNTSFTGNYGVTVGNGAVQVSGTNDRATIFGQSLSGNFSFTNNGSSVNLHASSLNLSLGGGLVLVSGGAANFTVTQGAITGTASGTLSAGSSETGVSFGGLVTVAVTTAGVTVSGTGCTVTLGSTNLTADLVFSKDITTGALDVAINNMTLATDASSPSVVVSGTLQVLPTGMSGTLVGHGTLDGVNGTITATFANGTYTISAGVSASFSESMDGANISGTVVASGTTGSAGTTGGSGNIELTNLMISLGNGLLQLTGGTANLTEVGGELEGTVSGTASLNGVSGVTLGGGVSITFTPTSINVSGTGDQIGVLGQTLTGNFTFADGGNGTVNVGASNLAVALANTVSLSNGTANFVIGTGGISGSGNAAVNVTVPGISFGGNFGLAIDNTNGNDTFTVSANPITITVGSESLTGNFAFHKITTSSGLATESLVASGINVYLGDGATGVQISNAGGSLLILPTGIAMDVSGTAALQGVSGLTLGGTLDVRFNNTGAAVDQTVPAPDPSNPGQTTTKTLVFTANENDISGTANLAVGTFASLSGGFNIAEQQSTANGIKTTKLLIGAAGLNASLGSNEGVSINNANLGLVVVSQTNALTDASITPGEYALNAAGAAALFGVNGLVLTGTLAVEADTAGAITQEIDVPDPKNPGSTIPVTVNFTQDIQAFAGTGLTLAVQSGGSTLVSIGGNFSFSKASGVNNPVLVTASNATAFVGAGAVGLQLANGQLGLILGPTGYALDASGNVSLTGLPGLNVSGALSIDVNTTGSVQTNPENTSATIPVDATPVIKVTGLTFAIVDSSNDPVLSIVVNATITKQGSVEDINATSAQMQLTIAGTQLISLQGTADLTIGSSGFALGPNGFSVTSFSLLGGAFASPAAEVAYAMAQAQVAGRTSAGGLANITAPTLPSGTPRQLGPLSLYNLSPVVKGFGFSNNELTVNVGLQADAATLTFGGSGGNGGTEAVMTGIAGSLQIAVGVDPSALKVTSFGGTGAFDFSANSFVLNVPDVVNVSAQNIDVTYNPQASSSQQIISIGTATVAVPFGSGGDGISGQISPYTNPSTGVTIPGLVVYGDHFQLGTGTIQYNGTLAFGGVASFTNPYVTITNLSASFGGGLTFNGGITLGAGELSLGPSSFQFTGSGVAATLTDTSGDWGFDFTAASLGLKLGPVTLGATHVGFDPTASGTTPLVEFSSLSATLALANATISGSAGSPTGGELVIEGNGSVNLPNDFAIAMSIGAGNSGALGWPTWLPIQVSSVVLAWPDFNDDKSDFSMTFNATMNATYGEIELQGSLQNITVDVGKLIDGEFPITGIQSASITASGDAFGGQLSGSLVLGVIQLDAEDHVVAYGQPYDHTLFYAGIEAQLTTPEGGMGIRFGLTQNGPLQAYVDISAPIEIFPPADIAITSLYGGVTFDAAPLPTISKAIDLESAVFSPGTELTTAQWQIQLQQETILQAGGGSGGYIFSVDSDSGGIADDLNAGLVDTTLAQDFLNESDPLAGSTTIAGTPISSLVKTTVVVENPGEEWLIVDGSNFYVITTNQIGGGLDVSKDSFAIDSAGTGADAAVGATVTQLVADLNSGTVSQQLIDAFAAYRIGIDTSAVITANAGSSVGAATNSWTIKDNGYTYLVTKDSAGVLNVLTSGGSISSVNSTIQIEAAVTLGFGGTGGDGASGTGDVIIDTDGKVLLDAYVDFGAQNTGAFDAAAAINFRTYIDLSHAGYGDASTLFLFQELVPAGDAGNIPVLTIAAGATFAHTDASGNLILPGGAYANATPAGFGIELNGTIIAEPVPDAQLILNGDAELAFFSNHATLTFDASLSANIDQFIQADNVVTAAGAFTFDYGSSFKLYGAAELIFDSGAIPFLENAGISADAIVFLRLNTDLTNSDDITFDIPTPGQTGSTTPVTIDLQPLSFGLYLVGNLTFNKGPVDFGMSGVFDVDFDDTDNGWQFDMFAFAELHLGVAGETLLTLDGLGLFQIDDQGFAAMLAVQSNTDLAVLDFDFNLAMYVNTTGQAVTYTVPNDLENIIEQVNTSSFSGQIDNSGPDLGDSLLTAMKTEIDTITGTQSGNDIHLTIPAGVPSINRAGQVTGYGPAGPYFIISGNGDLTILDAISIDGEVQLQASPDGIAISLAASLDFGPLTGISISKTIDLGAGGLIGALPLNGTFNFAPVATLQAAATLEINTSGEDQTVQEYTFDDSTGQISSTKVPVVIPADQELGIRAIGRLQLLDSFSIDGSFLMTLNDPSGGPTNLNVQVVGQVNHFFGASLDVDGTAQIDTEGHLELAIAADFNAGITDVYQINGAAIVEVNSTGGNVTLAVPGQGNMTIAPGAYLQVDASAQFLHFVTLNIAGNAYFNSVTDDFTIAFEGNASLSLLVFSGSIHFGGWIDSSGQFALGLSGQFGVSFGIGSVSGGAYVGLAWSRTAVSFDTNTGDSNYGLPVYTNSSGQVVPITPISYSGNAGLTVTGNVFLSGQVLGIGVSFSATIYYSQVTNELSVHATVRIKIIFVTISVGVTIQLGSLSGGAPPVVYLAGTPYAAKVAPASFSGGTLVLNVGALAGNRNYNNSDTNEDIVIVGANNYNPATGTQTIYVTIDGYSQAFNNVSNLVIPADGANTIDIANSVDVPLKITAGAAGENATILDGGSGSATITGGAGNDIIEAGSGRAVIAGGGGNDTIVAGTAADTITTTGSGASQILWNADQDGPLTLTGDNAGDELVVTTDTPGTNYASGEAIAVSSNGHGVSQIVGAAGNPVTFKSVPAVYINSPGGNNPISLGNMTGSGITNLSLVYGATHDAGNALSLLGSTGNDTYTLSSDYEALPNLPSAPAPGSQASPSSETADPSATPATANTVQTVTMDDSNGFNVTIYGASAGAGDSLSANSNGGTDTYNVQSVVIPTTLQGDNGTTTGDSTYYYIGEQPGGNQGTLSGINSTLTIDGTSSDDDIVVLEDQADTSNRTFDMTSTQAITDATGSSGKIYYNAGINNLDLDAGTGQNSYVVKSTGASTLTQILTGNSDNNFVVNGPITDPLAIDGGSSLFGQNTLTVNGSQSSDALTISPGLITGDGANIYYANMDGLTVNGNGGNDSFTLQGNLVPVTLLGSTGNDAFTVNGSSAPVSINSGSGTDVFTVNGNGAPMNLTGSGNDTFTINANSASLVATGGSGIDIFNVAANTGQMTLDGGTGSSNHNTYNIQGNSSTLDINSDGSSTYNIADVASPVTVNGQTYAADYYVTAPLDAPLTIAGTSTVQNLVVTGTVGDDSFTITPTQILGCGAPITYSGFATVTIYGNGGNDSYTITGTSAATTLNTTGGNATVDVESISNALTINNTNGTGVYSLGDNGSLGAIAGLVTINGTGNDTLNLDDSADALAQSGTITTDTIAGMGMGGGGAIDYTGLDQLNITLGSGAQSIAVDSTNAATPVNLTTGQGSDVITVLTNASALAIDAGSGANTINVGNAGVLAGIQGSLTIDGGGNGTLNVEDQDDTTVDQTGQITATAITGFGMDATGIAYTGMANLNIALGSGGTALTVASTPAAATQITGGNAGDNIAVQSTTGPLTIHTGTGANTIAVGDLLSAIQGAVTIDGGGTDSLTLDNTADTTSETGTMTASQITGLGMGTGGMSYSGISQLEIDLGNGNNNFTIAQTSAATTLLGGTGNDTVNVQATSNPTVVNVGLGTNTVNAGAPQQNAEGKLLAGIAGALSIIGGGTDTLNLDDTANTAAATGTVTADAITGFAPASITYSGDVALANLNLSLGNVGGSGGNTLHVQGTPLSAITTLSTGAGNDTVTIASTGGTTDLNTGAGNDTVNVQGTDGSTTVNTGTGTDTVLVTPLNTIQGSLNVIGNAADTLKLDDSGDHLARNGTITANAVTGFGMGSTGVAYTGVGNLIVKLGSGGTAINIANTSAATSTAVTGTTGNDSITVQNDAGATSLTAGTGTTTMTVLATGAATTLTGGSVNLGNGTVDQIHGPVSVDSPNLTIDDAGSTTAKDATLSTGEIVNLSPAPISYTGAANLTIDLGTSADTFTVTGTGAVTTLNGGGGDDSIIVQQDSNPTTINTGTGNNIVNILATDAPTTVNSAQNAIDTILLGSGGTLAGINTAVQINGNGSDVVTLNDQADSVSRTVSINATTVTGLAPAAIDYTNAAQLTVLLGTATDSVAILNTNSATQTDVTGGSGNDNFTVQNDSGITNLTGAGASSIVQINGTGAATTWTTPNAATAAITVGNSGSTANLLGALTVNGSGNDSLTIDDSADTAATNVTLAATTVAGAAPTAIAYTGVAQLNINLGTGGNDVTVAGTAADTSTSLSTGAGDDAVTIAGTTGPLQLQTGGGNNTVDVSNATNSLADINGTVTLTGDGFDRLSLDDTGDTAAQSGTVTASAVSGLSPAPIDYTGVAALTVSLDNAGNNLAVVSTNSSTTTNISAGSGEDEIMVGDNGQLSTIAGPLAIFGTGTTGLTLNDSNDSSSTTDTLNPSNFTGANPANISFNGLATLDILLGNGGNAVTVTNTAAGNTMIRTGAGSDTVAISATTGPTAIQTGSGQTQITAGSDLAAIAGALTLAGNGSTQVTLDDSNSDADKSVVVLAGSIQGLSPAAISYTDLANLNVQLGSGSDDVTVASTSANTTTSINAGTGAVDFQVLTASTPSQSSSIQGPLAINGNVNNTSLLINDSAGTNSAAVVLTDSSVNGLGAAISYDDLNTLTVELGQSNDQLTVSSVNSAIPTTVDGGPGNNSATLDFTGDFNGNLTLKNFQGGQLDITGNDNGSIRTDGSLNSVAIGGSVTSSASLAVAGNVAGLAIGGTNSGTISAGSTNAGVITNAVPDANGTIFSVTTNGITRSVQAISASGQPLVGVTFDLVYGQTAADPSVTIAVNNADAANERFDLVLQSTAGGTLDLAGLTSGGGAAGVRNVVVNGSLTGAGIDLPADHLAAVSVTGNLPARSINAASIEAFAFSTITGLRGRISPAGLAFTPKAFVYALALNPATGKPYAAFAPVTDTLRAMAPAGGTVGLYAVTPAGTSVDSRGLLLSAGPESVTATVAYGIDSRKHNLITSLNLTGNGGVIDTKIPVQNLTSNGSLGSVDLRAGKGEQLASLTATNITGNINLHGGTLTGTLQTTGVQTDPISGATAATSADLGTATDNRVTTLQLNMGENASIVSRGNLISQVQLGGSLNGTIAAAGDIGMNALDASGKPARLGGIQTGRGNSAGQVIALGNILGDVSIAGSLSGQIAARGTPIPGTAANRQGILSNVKIAGAIEPVGAVLSGGEIGDAAAGTQLATGKIRGTIFAAGPVQLARKSKSPSASGGLPVGASPIAKTIWSPNGRTVENFDSDSSNQDLATLSQLEHSLRAISGG